MAASIHPTAFISAKAHIGENVQVGPCAVIEDDVIIGDNCRIDAFASIKRFTRMGEGNIIHSYTVVGGEPQDLKFKGEESWLELGNHNTIREFATLHRGTEGGGAITRVGSNNLFMAYTHVAHDCIVGNRVVMSNNATLAGHVTVQDYAIIGGLSAVHQFCRIGEHAFVGGMTGAGQDLPPYMLATGSRGAVHGPNAVGLRRMGASSALISALKHCFRLFWLSEMPRQDALTQLEANYQEFPEVMNFVQFIRESGGRGVLPATKEG